MRFLGLNLYRSILTLTACSLHPHPHQCRPECSFQHVGGRVPDSTQQWLRSKGRILILSSWPDISVSSCDFHDLSCFPRGRRRKWRWIWDLGRVTLWALAEEARRGKVMVVSLLDSEFEELRRRGANSQRGRPNFNRSERRRRSYGVLKLRAHEVTLILFHLNFFSGESTECTRYWQCISSHGYRRGCRGCVEWGTVLWAQELQAAGGRWWWNDAACVLLECWC